MILMSSQINDSLQAKTDSEMIQNADSKKEMYKVENFVLKNGMRLIVNEDNSTNLISHYIVYNVGGIQDFHGKAGIAHFLEHMMFKSTKNFKEGDLTKFFNNNGVIFNAGTGKELTVYYETAENYLLEDLMKFESDRMQNLILKKDEIDNERNVIKEERRMRVDNVPIRGFIEKLEAVHYDSEYYGASLIGLMSDLDNIKEIDLENFYKQYYDPSNATLILSGNVSAKNASQLAEKYYGVLENRIDKDFSEKHSPKINPADLVKTKISDRFYLDLKSENVKSPTYIQVFCAPTLRSKERDLKPALALDILAFLLKEGKDMLFSEFVEKQKIASDVSMIYESFGGDFYPLKLILIAKKNDDLNFFEEKIKSFFQNDLSKILNDEIVEKTARIMGIDHIYNMDILENRAEFISYAALVEKIENPGEFLNQYPRLLLDVKKEDILKVASDVFLKGPSTIGKLFEKKI